MGRWDPNTESWVQDDVTSVAVDGGDPNSGYSHEPIPNGGRINMGAYGNTSQASRTECYPNDLPDYSEWVAFRRPVSWCYVSQCYGDADGKLHAGPKTGGYYHVGGPDLTILVECWKKKYINDDEPTALNYLDADFDHNQHGGPKNYGFHRVGGPDLTILATNWKKKCIDTGSGDPNCSLEDCGGNLGEKFTDKGI